MQIAQVFPVFESTSGRVAALAGLASLEERFQGEKGCGKAVEGAGSPADRLLGQLVATKHKTNFFTTPENAFGGRWKVGRARLFTAMPRGVFPKSGQLKGTGITGENMSHCWGASG